MAAVGDTTTYGPNAEGVTFVTTVTSVLLGTPLTYSVAIYDGPTTGTPIDTFTNVAPGNIITDSTYSLASLLNGSDYFVPPGSTTSITVTASLLSSPTIYVGGNATLSSTVSLASGVTVDVVGGNLTAGNGADALSGTTVNLSDGGTYTVGSGLLSLLSGTTVNFDTAGSGGTFVANAGGALLDLSSLTINNFNQATDKIEFDALAAPVDHYSVATSGSSQVITLYSSTGAELGSVTVAGTALDTGTFSSTTPGGGPLTVTEDGAGSSWDISIAATPGSFVITCFVGGTLIATPEGEKAVETLTLGDLVLTNEGKAVPVRWIGRRVVSTVFSDPLRVMPVRIRAGALGDNLPRRDLLVSPDHAMLVGNVLVNAGALVNGVSIVREQAMPRSFTYYHVEVDEHELILAEGAATETFIDNVDRMAFDNWAEHAEIFGDMPEVKAEMSYPRVKSSRQLPRAIRVWVDAQVAEEAACIAA